MELLEVAVDTALLATIRLGLPLVVLFLIGYRMHRDARRRAARPDFERSKARIIGRAATAIPCWQRNGCPADVRERCPAHRLPELPCWRAVKTARGRIKAACPGCALFLVVPALEQGRRQK